MQHASALQSGMPTPYLIIDGYNLMHAAGLARRNYARGELARCRRQLNQLLVTHLDADVLARATVVYDAFDSPSNANRQHQQAGLAIQFAPKGADADSEIEQLLNGHSAPRQVMVVSSDHRLHKAAKRRKARCVDSEDFLTALQTEPQTKSVSRRQKAVPDSASATDGKPADAASLQQWADQHERQSALGEDPASTTAFEKDYLKRLQDDIRKGRLK